MDVMHAPHKTLTVMLLTLGITACEVPTGLGDAPGGIQISVGNFHACRAGADGVWCWGNNGGGQTGQDTSARTKRPIMISTPAAIEAVAAGALHSCGLGSEKVAYCWGANIYGEFGDGTTQFSAVPIEVPDIRFQQLSAGNAFTCGLDLEGFAYCWGANDVGQLGIQDLTDTCSSRPCSTTPVRVASGPRLRTITAGESHACGLTSHGAAYCWGRNVEGALGNGLTTARAQPVLVEGSQAFLEISAGGGHTCAIEVEGTLYCWGRAERGQLGTIVGLETCAGALLCTVRPVPVSTQLRFVRISAGGTHTCGLTRDGVAYCWGANRNAQLGNNDIFDNPAPQRVVGDLRFVQVDAGALHTCGLTRDGEVYCWGDNFRGQLGNGDEGLRKSAPDLISFAVSP